MGDTLKGLAIFSVAAAVPFIVSATDLFGNEHAGVMKAVAAELRDPASAQFRDIQQGTTTACGEVNGKNAMGGYAGFKKFAYRNGVVMFEPEAPATFTVTGQTDYYNNVARFARLEQACYK